MLKKWGCDQVQGFYYGRPEAGVSEDEKGDQPLDEPSASDRPLDRPLVA
jgi:EAL domain-containing protein (putative c-di-GMP-specific phosphodiesterase class I)